jgi:hypothetical protein
MSDEIEKSPQSPDSRRTRPHGFQVVEYATYQELTSEGSFEIAERAIRGALVGEISRRLNHT